MDVCTYMNCIARLRRSWTFIALISSYPGRLYGHYVRIRTIFADAYRYGHRYSLLRSLILVLINLKRSNTRDEKAERAAHANRAWRANDAAPINIQLIFSLSTLRALCIPSVIARYIPLFVLIFNGDSLLFYYIVGILISRTLSHTHTHTYTLETP